MRLDLAWTLYRIGFIVDQNVRCRTAKTPAFTIRRDVRREARGDRSAHDRASRYGPFACLLRIILDTEQKRAHRQINRGALDATGLSTRADL